MKQVAFTVALTMLTAGCGVSEEDFQEQATELLCELIVDCMDAYDTVDDCIADVDPFDADSTCTYSRSQARGCLDAIEALTCDSTLDGPPAACEEVYDCPDDGDTM